MNRVVNKKIVGIILAAIWLAQACAAEPIVPAQTSTPVMPTSSPTSSDRSTPVPLPTLALPTIAFIPTQPPPPTEVPLVPNFEHIAIVMFENKEFGTVIGNPQMPNFNKLAREYTLLTQFYAVTHPSLPNYIALISGDTQSIDRNCNDCFTPAPSLPYFIDLSGRTWKTYQEDMPSSCYLGDTNSYVQKHNPFIYFDYVRLVPEICERSVVTLTALQTDIHAGSLPNFMFITPNLCNSAHDCSLDVTDAWMTNLLSQLVPALDAKTSNYLLVLTWDEGQGSHSCCGLPEEAG